LAIIHFISLLSLFEDISGEITNQAFTFCLLKITLNPSIHHFVKGSIVYIQKVVKIFVIKQAEFFRIRTMEAYSFG